VRQIVKGYGAEMKELGKRKKRGMRKRIMGRGKRVTRDKQRMKGIGIDGEAGGERDMDMEGEGSKDDICRCETVVG
jgi:hypothetical protein